MAWSNIDRTNSWNKLARAELLGTKWPGQYSRNKVASSEQFKETGHCRTAGTNWPVQNNLKKLATAEQLEQNGQGNSSKKLARAE